MTNPNSNARLMGFFLVAAIGVFLTVNMMSAWYLSLVSTHWPTTEGRVLNSQVSSGTTTIGDWWAPSVKYEYRVGANTFQAGNIRFYMPMLRDPAAADALRSPYPAGKLVSVSYDPKDPNRSVLEPGFCQPIWKPTLVALMFWSMAAFLFYEVTHPERSLLSSLRRPDSQDQEEGEEGADSTALEA